MGATLRGGAAVFAALALLTASCGEDTVHTSAGDDEAPTESVPVPGDPPHDNGDDGAQAATTEPTPPPPFTGVDHSSTAPAVALCDALATREGSAVVDLMADDAIATDHATGVVYRGRREIRPWLDDNLSFDLFERTTCAPSDSAIASHFWSAVTYTFHSDTNPGGTEGIVVAGIVDGEIVRFDALNSLIPGQTDVAATVSADDHATATAFCEAWGTFDVDQVLQLVTDDVLVTPNTMSVDDFFRSARGADAVRGAMTLLEGGTVNRVECGSDVIANGGWIAHIARFVDDESDTTVGGIAAVRLRDGLVSANNSYMDVMVDGALVFEATQPEPPPDSPADPAVLGSVESLEVTGWWDFAGEFLGTPLSSPEARQAVAADVVEICAFLETNPTSFDDLLDELNRLAERRASTLSTDDAQAYSFVLDTAISAACPDAATVADALRPPPDPSELPAQDLVAREVLDPRPGDLRTDQNADVLPALYEPVPAAWTVRLAYGTDPDQQLDLHLPRGTAAPVVVFLHSGGWTGGSLSEVNEMVLRFVEQGYAVASVGYRLAPDHPFPAQIHDAKHAIRFLKAFDEREGLIDGERMVLFGTSAGGHIAAFAAATSGLFEPTDITPEEATFDSKVAGLVSVVGPTDLVSFSRSTHPLAENAEVMLGCRPCSDAQLAEASPINYLSPGLPPAYWAYGSQDRLVDWDTQGAAIASAWAEQGSSNSSWFDLVDEQGHNINHTTINQRELERFVDYAVSPR